MRPNQKRITLALLSCTLGAIVFFGGKTLWANEVPNIPPLKISPQEIISLEETGSPCGGRTDTVPYEEPVITSAPIASYPATALKTGVTGNVRLFAYFEWNGKVSGLAVVQGQPSGLTQEAIKAAKAIKFKPAKVCGEATTEPVEIHYDFPGGQPKLVRL